MNEKITVLAKPVIKNIRIIRGTVKETAGDDTERRRYSGDMPAICKHRKNWYVKVRLDFHMAPGNKSRAACWKWEGGIFRIT